MRLLSSVAFSDKSDPQRCSVSCVLSEGCTSLVLHTQGTVLNQVLAGVIVYILNSITQLLKGKALLLEELLSVTTDQSLNIESIPDIQ